MLVVLAVGAGRRSEAVIERAEPTAGHVRHHAVEDAPSRFIRIETVMQELPEQTTALRRAKTEGASCDALSIAPQWILVAGIVFQIRNEVPDAGEPHTLDNRPFRLIDH